MSGLGDNLSVQDKALPPKKHGKQMGPKYLSRETRRIMVEENSDIPPTGLFIQVNGYAWLVKPGVPIDAPLPLIEVLDNAVISMPVVDPNTLQVKGYRERMRFSYRNMPNA